MSTGMGGTNAHVVLEEAPQLASGSSCFSMFQAARPDQDTLKRELQPFCVPCASRYSEWRRRYARCKVGE